MFFWKKKHTEQIDFSWLHTDMHSHLIPGIDDGASDSAASLELVQGLIQLGYQKLITTPHILWDVYANTPEIITRGFEVLKESVTKASLSIQLHAAAEYFIDDYFANQLKNKVPLLCVSGNYVLVEFSMLTAPFDLHDVLFEMQIQNYQPIIAHPERYSYLANKKSFFDELKSMGCAFQLNLLSLTGYYGKAIQELAEYLVKMNYYDFAGTDMHNTRHLASLQKLSSSPVYHKLKEGDRLKNRLL